MTRLAPALVLLAACGEAPPDVAPGPTGYISDRAIELTLALHGTLSLPTAEVEASRALRRTVSPAPLGGRLDAELDRIEALRLAAGLPIVPSRARVAWTLGAPSAGEAGRSRLPWSALLDTWISARDLPPGAPGLGAYASDPAVLYASPTSGDASPGSLGLADDGRVVVGVLLGQMDRAVVRRDDPGARGVAFLEGTLQGWGFSPAGPMPGGAGRAWLGSINGIEVVVHLHDPLAAAASPDEQAGAVRRVVAGSEVAWLSLHAGLPGLDALAEPLPDAGPRLVVLDVCWSYYKYVASLLTAAAGPLHVVSAASRVVTGSVEGLPIVLRGLVGADGGPTWVELLADLNDAAEARAAERAGALDGRLWLPEIYGVSGALPYDVTLL